MNTTQRYLVLSYTTPIGQSIRLAVPVYADETDSATLRQMLSYTDPGNDYSVKFTSRKPAKVEWLWTV